MSTLLSGLLAAQLALCAGLALRECWCTDGADRVIMASVAAVMLAMRAGALAGL